MIKKVVIAFFLVFSAQLFASDDKAFFWKVTSETATVYMLGSIHYADKSFYPLRKEIERAFDKSDVLVVEINMNEEAIAAYQEIVAGKGTYIGDETIKDNVSQETYRVLKDALQKLDVPIEAVNKKKPGILVLTLAGIKAMSLGLDPSLGIDSHFMGKAKGEKTILALETIEQQLDIFLNASNEDLLLKETLYSMDEAGGVVNEMVKAWKLGDENKMHQLFFEDAIEKYPEFASIYDLLIFKRNKAMTEKIQSYLKINKTYFVIIGAGHFIGEQGIIRLLEKANYSVKRL